VRSELRIGTVDKNLVNAFKNGLVAHRSSLIQMATVISKNATASSKLSDPDTTQGNPQ
jgi:hypothetical protein